MTRNRPDIPDTPSNPKAHSGEPGFDRLAAWPIALVVLTLLLMLVANSVSAWGRHEAPDREEIKEHVSDFVGRTLDRIDATEEQDVAIQEIVAQTIDELAAAHGERHDLREQFSSLMTAETIDREALEGMRAGHLARADEMSRILVDRLADVMQVLTPEQRQELEERFEKRHRRFRRWH